MVSDEKPGSQVSFCNSQVNSNNNRAPGQNGSNDHIWLQDGVCSGGGIEGDFVLDEKN
jgi:hypothetical protein